MDQIKIGKFIASCRKEKNLTQAQLAEKLGITDRAVSKWETSKSMPDTGLMPELCELLGISVNELLSGEKLNLMEDYRKNAELNLLALKEMEESKNRELLNLEWVVYGNNTVFGFDIHSKFWQRTDHYSFYFDWIGYCTLHTSHIFFPKTGE